MQLFRRWKNFICALMIMVLAFGPAFSVRAYAVEEWPGGAYVTSEGACLMDADSKTILFGKNPNEAYYPASITKVLTALVVLENCDNLNEQVTFSYDAVHIEEENSTIIGASEFDRLSVLDCLYCLLFQSANEVANALAEHVGAKHPELREEGMNDRAVFVRMMNEKAEELGCTGSHFNNPSGLTDEYHYTTAHDMCLIMAAAIRNEKFVDIEAHTYWTHGPIKRYPDANDPWNTVYPKHQMLRKTSSQYYKGTFAGKTGYTMNAGNTLVTACKRDGMTLVVCVLNAHASHYNDTIRLMDFGFDNFKSLKVSDYDDTDSLVERDFSIAGLPVIDSFTIGIAEDNRITIPADGSFEDVQRVLVTEDAGEGVLARLHYSYGGRGVGTAELRLIPLGMTNGEEAAQDPLLLKITGQNTVSKEKIVQENPTEESDTEAAEISETGESESGGAETMQVTEGTPKSRDIEKSSRPKVLILAIRAGIVLVCLGIGYVILRLMIERKESIERARRRKRREKYTRDLTGSQNIDMDLMVQERLKKSKRKRKKKFF